VAAALLRSTLTSTVLVVLYFRLPLTGALEASTVALLLAGLALFAGVIVWQVQSILRSEYPALRAIEALAAAVPCSSSCSRRPTSRWPTPRRRRSTSR
jgi:voltage-gated potassium channel